MAGKEDEFVKNMNNLPEYLQRAESRNAQGNALNIGVLDWAHLETWMMSKAHSSAPCPEATAMKTDLQGVTQSSGVVYNGIPKAPLNAKGKKKNVHGDQAKKTMVEKSKVIPVLHHPHRHHASNDTNSSFSRKSSSSSNSVEDLGEFYKENFEVSDFFSDAHFHLSDPSEKHQFSGGMTPEDWKSKHSSSSNQRHSFNLRQMSRSFSFKESSPSREFSFSDMSSISGPLSKSSLYLEDVSKEKAKSRSQTPATPLTRSLDPLLKSKGGKPLPLMETNLPITWNLNAHRSKPITAAETISTKNEDSWVQASLQVMIRDGGHSLFQFIVENNSSILAAAPKNNAHCDYVFYAIDEVKKKNSSWMSSSKEKCCGYVGNIVGQMKTNCYFNSAGELPTFHAIQEFVLLGSAPSQEGDDPSATPLPDSELAAVIVKMPCGGNWVGSKLNHDEEEAVIHDSATAIAILPNGIHGSSREGGAPSPLIQRWRSGGLCDCGGWDVGCGLRTLSSKMTSLSLPPCLDPDCFNLYLKGISRHEKPIFSLVSMDKGLYCVKFDASISLLQAIFICITIMNCEKSFDYAYVDDAPEEKLSQISLSATCENKAVCDIVPDEPSLRYTPCPPVSPFERV